MEEYSYSRTTRKIIKFTHAWNIENFSFFVQEKIIKSPPFGAEGDPNTRWSLELIPKGDTEENKVFISLHLRLVSSELSELHAKATLSVQGSVNGVSATRSFEAVKKFLPGTTGGFSRFIRLDSILEHDQSISVGCEVSYATQVEEIASQESKCQPKRDPTGVLAKLYETRMHSDVVLSVNGKEYEAHRAILAARSSTLKAMFEPDCKTGETSRIDVIDMDNETLEDLLRFLYFNEAEVPDNMHNLISAIDKHFVRGR